MLLYYSSYMIGEKKNPPLTKEPYRISNEDEAMKIATIFQTKSKTAKDNLLQTNSVKKFYEAEPDLLFYIDEKQREEYFYVAKTGLWSPVIPGKLLFMLKSCYALHGTCNMLFNYIPKSNIKEVTASNFIAEDISISNIIKDYIDPVFNPLTENDWIVPHGTEYSDIYIQAKDRVLIAPNKIANIIKEDVASITVKGNTLLYNKSDISKMGGYLGLKNSVYDYRDLI